MHEFRHGFQSNLVNLVLSLEVRNEKFKVLLLTSTWWYSLSNILFTSGKYAFFSSWQALYRFQSTKYKLFLAHLKKIHVSRGRLRSRLSTDFFHLSIVNCYDFLENIVVWLPISFFTILNSKYSFPLTGFHTRLMILVYPTVYCINGRRSVGFFPSHGALL